MQKSLYSEITPECRRATHHPCCQHHVGLWFQRRASFCLAWFSSDVTRGHTQTHRRSCKQQFVCVQPSRRKELWRLLGLKRHPACRSENRDASHCEETTNVTTAICSWNKHLLDSHHERLRLCFKWPWEHFKWSQHASPSLPGLSWGEKHWDINSAMFSRLLWKKNKQKNIQFKSHPGDSGASILPAGVFVLTWSWSLWHTGGPAAGPPTVAGHSTTEPCSNSGSPGRCAYRELQPNKQHQPADTLCTTKIKLNQNALIQLGTASYQLSRKKTFICFVSHFEMRSISIWFHRTFLL